MTIENPGRRLLAALALLCTTLFMAGPATATPERELVILTWSDYMDPELVSAFERQHQARVRFVYFESDELRDDLLVNSDGRGYDLICVNGRMLQTYADRGWLQPLDDSLIPTRRLIDPRWTDAFPAAAEYGLPYFWGTMGIAYRSDLLATPLTRWSQLLDPPQALQGRIQLVKDSRDLMAMALKSLGHSVNDTDPQVLAQAEELLFRQRPHVRDYSYVAMTGDSSLVTGDTLAALMYSGDALMLAEFNENIVYVVPEEGTVLWVDYFAVARHAREPALAMQFLDFMNTPEHAARQAEFVYYATPNRAAEALLPAEFREDPVIYPSAEVLARSETYRPLPPRAQRRYNQLLPQLTGGE